MKSNTGGLIVNLYSAMLEFGLRFRKVPDSANLIIAAVIFHKICQLHVDDIDEKDGDFAPN